MVEYLVTVESVVVRTMTEVEMTVDLVGVTVSVLVGPVHGVVIVDPAKISVWVCVPMVEKTAIEKRECKHIITCDFWRYSCGLGVLTRRLWCARDSHDHSWSSLRGVSR